MSPPSELNSTLRTDPPCHISGVTGRPLSASQILAPSSDAVAMRSERGSKAANWTDPPGSTHLCGVPSATHHSCARPSSEAVSTRRPSLLKRAVCTGPRWRSSTG